MKAIGVKRFGGPDALEFLEVPEPRPGSGEVRVRVHAVAVNPTDTLIRAGVRRQTHTAPPYVPGMDAAGVIDQIGPGVDGRLTLGMRLVALVVPLGTHGSYAEKIVVPASSVVAAPVGVSFAEASVLLMNAMTARLAVDALDLTPGAVAAVTGAAGTFGGYAVQLAAADGIRVVADAKSDDVELVTALGATDVVKRGDGFAERVRRLVPTGVSGVADGALLNDQAIAAIADNGVLATLREWDGPAERGIEVRPVRARCAASDTAGLERLVRQAEQGVLTLRVARVPPAAAAVEAHRMLESGGLRGRIVLDFTTVG